MLFNSYIFIFAFLPVVLLAFYRIGRSSRRLAALWLAAASLFFYGWWDARLVGLLLASVGFNYAAGFLIGHRLQQGKQSGKLLAAAIGVNLALLGYFKYANFFIANFNAAFGLTLPIGEFFLPLGISFFTFTQIAFLVDTWRGKVHEYDFVHYLLFVTYFPHLIAGPVLHHAQMMPQFARPATYRVNWEHIALGVSIFVMGLAKKVLLADSFAEFASPVFDIAQSGGQPMFFEAWIGALSYTLQLYFDFSAYSDMAIGLSLMFNVRLPQNFDSPYKATSIIDFWRRWHMTLSAFLRDYLYIALGGNRKGTIRRYANLMTTMLLGGLWHGAGWTFVMWGGLHGLYLLINHAWRAFKKQMGWRPGGALARFFAGSLTFLSVVVAWVFFRAESFSAGISMLTGMSGARGISLSDSVGNHLGAYALKLEQANVVFSGMAPLSSINTDKALILIILGLMLVWLAPNIAEITQRYRPTWDSMQADSVLQPASWLSRVLAWRPNFVYASLLGVLFTWSVFSLTRISEFLYFQF
ncbi:MAG: MBOAT family protein [Gallionella sp.]|nr:MBOAT family protein [Gallionella sp.]